MAVGAYPSMFYPGQVYPSQPVSGSVTDTQPQYNVRVDVAFTTDPDSLTPAWVDLSSRLDLSNSLSISRGRANEHEVVSPGKLSLTLDNTDGALTADRPSSPYYPNVKVGRRIRVTYRDPANKGQGNILAAEDASFEGGTTGTWSNNYFGAPAASTISNSTLHPAAGTKSLLATWPTASAGVGAGLFVDTVVGRTYTAKVTVWIPAGHPAVKFGDVFGRTSVATSTVTGSAQTLTITWTASDSIIFLALFTASASTSGQQCFIDALMVDEGTTLGSFTTTAPVVSHRFEGYVDEWPQEWPGGVDTYARAQITASDILARIGARRQLRSVVEETALLDSPMFYYTLAEPDGSTSVGDSTTGTNTASLTIAQTGAGGTIAFAAGTGPGTDGQAAPIFTPASVSAGKFLTGTVPGVPFGNGWDVATEVAFNTSTAADQCLIRWAEPFGSVWVEIGISAAGKLTYTVYNAWLDSPVVQTAASANTVSDGATHHAALRFTTTAGTTTATLVLDGVSVASGTFTALLVLLTQVSIGGTAAGRMFTGTLSHVAGYNTAPTVARFLEHRLAQTTGFAGERSDQRIARIAQWAGVPTSRQVLDVGMSTSIAHYDCTGQGALDYLRKVEATEDGLLYADGEGRLVFRSRAGKYTPKTPDVVLSSPDLLDRSTRVIKDLQLVVNDVTGSRPGGSTIRVVDSTSVAAYGVLSTSLDLLAGSDAEVADAVNWRVRGSSTPTVRYPSLELDAYTDATNGAALRGLTLLDYVQIGGMPTQAPTATVDQVIQGLAETISVTGWDITANTSTYSVARALVLDNATFGTLDGQNVLVY